MESTGSDKQREQAAERGLVVVFRRQPSFVAKSLQERQVTHSPPAVSLCRSPRSEATAIHAPITRSGSHALDKTATNVTPSTDAVTAADTEAEQGDFSR